MNSNQKPTLWAIGGAESPLKIGGRPVEKPEVKCPAFSIKKPNPFKIIQR